MQAERQASRLRDRRREGLVFLDQIYGVSDQCLVCPDR